MPDYFDRLARRVAPDAGGAPRVRPRLPGPFERVDALGGDGFEPPAPDTGRLAVSAQAQAPTVASADAPFRPAPGNRMPDPAAQRPSGQVPLAVRELAAPQRGMLTAPAVPPPAPRPAAPPVEETPVAVKAGRLPRPAELTERQQPVSGERPSGVRPSAVGDAPARTPARAAAAGTAEPGRRDRQSRPPERVVHVSIGRLEVKAAGRQGGDRDRRDERADRPSRPAPALSLRTYLSREEAER